MRAPGLLLGLLVALVTAPAAHATAFGPVRAVSPTGDVGDPQVAFRPDGSLRVAWTRSVDRDGRSRIEQVVRRGPSLARLGAPRVVPLPSADDDLVEGAAAPGRTGWRVSCRTTASASRGPVRCRVRRPDGGPGADIRVADALTDLEGVGVQPDGRLVVVTRAPAGSGSVTLAARFADAAGRVGAPMSLGSVPDGSRSSLVIDASGTALLTVVLADADHEPGAPRLRALPIGASSFGAPVALTPDIDVDGGVDVLASGGGTTFVVGHEPGARVRRMPTVVVRSLDGRLSAPHEAPGADTRYADVTAVAPASGPPAVLTTAFDESETDCGNRTVGRLTASAPGLTGVTRLSASGQIATDASLVELDDGMAAVWGDAAGPDGRTRVEAAFRDPSGRWSSGRPFGPLAHGDLTVGTDGHRVALAWSTGRSPDGPGRIVVALSTEDGPAAPLAARPRPSRSNCQ